LNKIMSGTLTVMGVLALAGCGHNAQQQAATTVAQKTSAQTPSPAGNPQVIDASALALAKSTNQPCSLDSIDGNYAKQVHVAQNKLHVFRGWLLDASRQPAGNFNLVLEGRQSYAIPAVTGVARPDVGDYLKNPALAQAGFEFSSALQDVELGQYTLLLMVKVQHRELICQLAKDVIVE